MKIPSMQALAAELLGTFLLTLLVLSSLIVPLPVATPVVAALTLGTLVYTIGSISGAHVNPAVTIGLWSIGKVPHLQAFAYIVVQILGAVLALVLSPYLLGNSAEVAADTSLSVGIAEALGAFLLVFGVSAVVLGRVKSEVSGIAIGVSLLLGILVASTGSSGILNPAVAIGLSSLSLPYLIGPIVGGIVGAWASKLMTDK